MKEHLIADLQSQHVLQLVFINMTTSADASGIA
jgi:hypothetical protein